MSDDSAAIFSTGTTPVVQLSSRKFPGVLIQGDRLANWVQSLRAALSGVDRDAGQEVLDDLETSIAHYIEVLEERKIDPPFNWPLPSSGTAPGSVDS